MIGYVKERGFNNDRGFGFIESEGQGYFLHASNLVGLPFDESLIGKQVEFDPVSSDRGLSAVNVRVAA